MKMNETFNKLFQSSGGTSFSTDNNYQRQKQKTKKFSNRRNSPIDGTIPPLRSYNLASIKCDLFRANIAFNCQYKHYRSPGIQKTISA